MFISLQGSWIVEIMVGFGKNTQMLVEPFIHFEFDSMAAYPSTGEPHHLSYHTYLIADLCMAQLIEAHRPLYPRTPGLWRSFYLVK